MMFYKAESVIVNHVPAETPDDQAARRTLEKRIAHLTESFCPPQPRDCYYFVADLTENVLTVGIITEQPDEVECKLGDYLTHIGYPPEEITIAEVTLGIIQNLLQQSFQNNFTLDSSDIEERFRLDRLSRIGTAFGDNVLGDRSRQEITQAVQQHLFCDTFLPELQRIYHIPASGKIIGHPVHYTVQTDDPDNRREVCRLLLQALYANRRLRSRRYTFLDITPQGRFSPSGFEALYRICDGGAVILRYCMHRDDPDEGSCGGKQDMIETICQIAKKHRNRVLTVICLPQNCHSIQAMFYEHLENMTFVELQEDCADAKQAKVFLKMLARKYHIHTDKALFARLEEGKGYAASELREIFDAWYNRKLKTSVFPQYRNLSAAGHKALKAAPKGAAYDELQSMIGLKEAKAVIQKALNYYKIQKLREDRGMKRENPAMHMVFTGNPGTAKTTAARLFARIMKDNGLLSRGQLVEVGRGDLVGKYVGWTAQTVQAKFKAAAGGVLFIDEAYSLADSQDGSFGDEAINTIVQEMENHRQDVVVIFAGYPKQMEEFLQKNPGLRSRIAFHVPFADYTPEELCQIAVLMGKGKGVCFETEALEKLGTIVGIACIQSDFGNGRYVRNLLEQAQMNQASRLLEYDFDDITPEAICTIKAVDLAMPEAKPEQKRTIGFAS